MTTQVQTTYRGQIEVGLEGMIAEMTSSEVGTRVNETAAGIPFGRAVSQGSRAGGCVIGGASFLGISVRDITLALSAVDPLAAGTGDQTNPLDSYGLYTNVAVMSRGRMWLRPQGLVAANDALFYDPVSGKFSNSASGLGASGWIRFSQQPAATNTLVINGATLTFVASGATGDQANIGPTLGDTVANAVKAMNDSATAGFAALTFVADPPTPVGGGNSADTIWITANAVGVGGNALAITSGPAGMTKSAGTLLGGVASATAITAAKWIDAASVGQLARATLGIQQ